MTNTGGITGKNLAQKDLAARTAVTQSCSKPCSSRSPNGISYEDARHACATGDRDTRRLHTASVIMLLCSPPKKRTMVRSEERATATTFLIHYSLLVPH